MVAHRHYTPKQNARAAGKRLGILISEIKQKLDEETLGQLRKWYLLAVNGNDSDSLHRMVKRLNEKRYQTRMSFQILVCDSGKTLEIREDRW